MIFKVLNELSSFTVPLRIMTKRKSRVQGNFVLEIKKQKLNAYKKQFSASATRWFVWNPFAIQPYISNILTLGTGLLSLCSKRLPKIPKAITQVKPNLQSIALKVPFAVSRYQWSGPLSQEDFSDEKSFRKFHKFCCAKR